MFGLRTRQKIIPVYLGGFLKEVNVYRWKLPGHRGGGCNIWIRCTRFLSLFMEGGRDSDDVFFFLDTNLPYFMRINPSVLN